MRLWRNKFDSKFLSTSGSELCSKHLGVLQGSLAPPLGDLRVVPRNGFRAKMLTRWGGTGLYLQLLEKALEPRSESRGLFLVGMSARGF